MKPCTSLETAVVALRANAEYIWGGRVATFTPSQAAYVVQTPKRILTQQRA